MDGKRLTHELPPKGLVGGRHGEISVRVDKLNEERAEELSTTELAKGRDVQELAAYLRKCFDYGRATMCAPVAHHISLDESNRSPHLS